jgi:hypothetical protein
MRSFLSRKRLLPGLVICLAAIAGLFFWSNSAKTADRNGPSKAAIERARTNVKMLDDLYKGFVVHITRTYVKARELRPAASVAKKVFKYMEEKGWHSGRLVDATGKPINEENSPQTDFEKRAIAKLKGGASYFDEVGVKSGRPVLRAATKVPVVMNQCINCHQGFKKGDLLGALVYEMPIK